MFADKYFRRRERRREEKDEGRERLSLSLSLQEIKSCFLWSQVRAAVTHCQSDGGASHPGGLSSTERKRSAAETEAG